MPCRSPSPRPSPPSPVKPGPQKAGEAPKQTVDFEEMAAAGGSLDLDENFYGDQDFDMEDFDQEGFDIGGGDAGNPYEEDKF